MSQDTPFHSVFKKILETEEYSQALQYDKEDVISDLNHEEKELFALLLIKAAVQSDVQHGLNLINRALEISQQNKILFTAAEVLATKTQNAECLQKSIELYQKLSIEDSNNPQILLQWGSALLHLGRLKQDLQAFHHAEELLSESAAIFKGDTSSQPLLSWMQAQCWNHIARHSGEPNEYVRALEFYRHATQFEPKAAFFWNDYANALMELGGLVKRHEVFEEVIELYQKAIFLDPRYFPSQFNLGLCYHKLYNVLFKDTLFWYAHEQYGKAHILDPQYTHLHKSWGKLLLTYGKYRRDHDILRQACDQLERAVMLDNNDLEPGLHLCEALIWCGGILEELPLLKHAEAILNNIIEVSPKCPQAWTLLGLCNYELGHYFSENQLIRVAIDKFAHSIQLERSQSEAWYGLALCTLCLGELEGDLELLQSSLLYFSRASEFEQEFYPQFWNDWGVAYMKLGELTSQKEYFELAIAKFEQTIELDSASSDNHFVDPEWYYNYGCACDYLGEITENPMLFEKSINILQKVVEIDPQYTQVEFNLAMAYVHLGEFADDLDAYQKANQHFHKFLQKEQDDELAWNEWGLCLINAAQLVHDPIRPALSQQYYKEAEHKFHQALALGSEIAHYNLACLYSLINDPHASIAHLEKAAASDMFPIMDDLLHDDWLDNIRHTEEFRKFLSNLSLKYKNFNIDNEF